jgi:hypothetical protein
MEEKAVRYGGWLYIYWMSSFGQSTRGGSPTSELEGLNPHRKETTRKGPDYIVDSCEHANETPFFIKGWEFLDWPGALSVSQKYSALWRYDVPALNIILAAVRTWNLTFVEILNLVMNGRIVGISASHFAEYEDDSLLVGIYRAVYCRWSKPTFQRCVLPPSSGRWPFLSYKLKVRNEGICWGIFERN